MGALIDHIRRAEPALLVRGVLVLAAVVAAVFGFLGYTVLFPPVGADPGPGPVAGVTDHVYWTLQLFLLDSAPLQEPRDTGVLLEIARFLAPATTASALAVAARDVLARFWMAHRTPRRRGHTVVVGSGPAALRVARSVLDEGRSCVLVDAFDPVRHPRRDRTLSRSRGAMLIRTGGDARQDGVLAAVGAAAAREIVAVGADDARHMEIAAAARRLLPPVPEQDPDDGEDRDPVAHPRPPAPVCVVEVRASAVATALAADELSRPRSVRVEFVDQARRAARALLDDALPGDSTLTAVAVIGTGPVFSALCAELVARVGAHRVRAGGGTSVLAPGAPDVVLVADDDVGEATRLALEAFAHVHAAAVRIIVATAASASLIGPPAATPSTGARISVVNAVDLVRDIRTLRHGLYGEIAQAIHAAYLAEEPATGPGVPGNPSAVPWASLPESLRESNRAQAFHIGAKMRTIGCAVVPAGTTAPAEPFAYRPGEVERLAVMEHNRWVRDRLGNGWTPGPRDIERKHSPYLVPWRDLPDDDTDHIKEKDRQAVRDLPAHITAAGLRIIRL